MIRHKAGENSMLTMIRPVSEIQRNMGELEKLIVEDKEIIALSKNSKEHMVLMSHDQYKRLYTKTEHLEEKVEEYEARLIDLESKIAIYEGLITSQGQYHRGESLSWQDAKARSDAQHRERLDAVQLDSDTTSSGRAERS